MKTLLITFLNTVARPTFRVPSALGLTLLALALAPSAWATLYTNAATGNWSATGTWIGGVVPTATDSVIITNGTVVTLTANTAIAGVTINSSGILDEGGFTLTNNGTFLNQGTFKNGSSDSYLVFGVTTAGTSPS